MKETTIGINAWCRVKLTKFGLKIVKEKCPWTLESSLRYNKQTKVYSDELWHLMRLFGECMWMGNKDNPFEKNKIKIINEDV